MPSDDVKYEAMVKAITDQLLELENYIATMPEHQEVVDVAPVVKLNQTEKVQEFLAVIEESKREQTTLAL